MRNLVAVAALMASVIAGGLTAAPAQAAVDPNYVPVAGPLFNSPEGSAAKQNVIMDAINDGIRNTPPGATIRFATYSINRAGTTRLLQAAFARGVNVQIVVNDNIISREIQTLAGTLGGNVDAPSFLFICKAACRNASPRGNQHMKTYSFSQTGAATDVILNTSANLTTSAIRGQWNDSYTVFGNPELFASWVTVFEQLKRDRSASPRKLNYKSDTVSIAYQRLIPGFSAAPRLSTRLVKAPTGDAPLGRVKRITCKTGGGFGVKGKTKVRIAMYAWYGTRGERIARVLAARKRQGCDIAVIGSVASGTVTRILKGSGIKMKAADWDFGKKLATSGVGMVYGPRCYSHLKFMTIDGTYKGQRTRVTFTGSENWSAPSLSSDEVTYEIRDATVLKQYNSRWQSMWNSKRATHKTGIEPKSRPCR